MDQAGLAALSERAGTAAELLRALASEHRLLVLCHLISEGELPVHELVERSGLSQSALSQHLGKLREQGLVTFRRDAQTLFYSVADPRAARLIEVLRDLFCPELAAPRHTATGSNRKRSSQRKAP
jgi:ArsR family transcriptional regulator, virulence genes transcriptional regulator